MTTDRLTSLGHDLPAHAELLDRLTAAIESDERWRWLEVGCSLAAGRADELSDIDAGAGYAGDLTPDQLNHVGLRLVQAGGPIVDHLVHSMPGSPPEVVRFAVEYQSGVQLDLVLAPAGSRLGLPDVSVAAIDKDDQLATKWTPPVAGPPSIDQAREWTMLGWWAVSDATKYIRRGSLFEAAERVAEVRTYALQLFATGRRIPYPSFGLTSLLDYPPFELPERLAGTYPSPADRADVVRSLGATVDLLASSSASAGEELGADLTTPWADLARARLALAATQPRPDRGAAPDPAAPS
jgi:hypothetical protein